MCRAPCYKRLSHSFRRCSKPLTTSGRSATLLSELGLQKQLPPAWSSVGKGPIFAEHVCRSHCQQAVGRLYRYSVGPRDDTCTLPIANFRTFIPADDRTNNTFFEGHPQRWAISWACRIGGRWCPCPNHKSSERWEQTLHLEQTTLCTLGRSILYLDYSLTDNSGLRKSTGSGKRLSKSEGKGLANAIVISERPKSLPRRWVWSAVAQSISTKAKSKR